MSAREEYAKQAAFLMGPAMLPKEGTAVGWLDANVSCLLPSPISKNTNSTTGLRSQDLLPKTPGQSMNLGFLVLKMLSAQMQ